MYIKTYSLWRANGCQEGFSSLAKLVLCGQKGASKPPQVKSKTIYMKNTVLLVLATILLNSCENDDYHYEFPSEELSFPHEGIYGLNVLNEETTEFVAYNESLREPRYSLKASVPINTTLKIIIENTSKNADEYDWFFSSGSNWYIHTKSQDSDNKTQVLVVYGQEVALTSFGFLDRQEEGSATIKFYKNDETRPFRTKKITWKP